MADIIQSSEDLIIIETDAGANLLETNTGGAQGVAGIQGPAGENGLSINWTGNWSSATAYSVNDAVHAAPSAGGSGTAFICIQANTNKDPDSGANSAYWQTLVSRPAGGVSLGPFESTRELGFCAPTDMTIYDEQIKPANSYTVDWRRKNGSSVSLPVTLAPGDIYSVKLSGVSGMVYASYKVR